MLFVECFNDFNQGKEKLAEKVIKKIQNSQILYTKYHINENHMRPHTLFKSLLPQDTDYSTTKIELEQPNLGTVRKALFNLQRIEEFEQYFNNLNNQMEETTTKIDYIRLQKTFFRFGEIFQLFKQQECMSIIPYGRFLIEMLTQEQPQMDVWIQYFTPSKTLFSL